MYRLDVKFPFDLETFETIGNRIVAYVGKTADGGASAFGADGKYKERDMQFIFKTVQERAEAAERVRKIQKSDRHIVGLKVIERDDLDPEAEDCGG